MAQESDSGASPTADGLEYPLWVSSRTSRELYEAFQRIISGKPSIVKKTARVTLSLVATEAGFQRSTLSRKMYPDLVLLIEQQDLAKPSKTMHALYKDKERVARELRDQLEKAQLENGILLNQLIDLKSQYFNLATQLRKLSGE